MGILSIRNHFLKQHPNATLGETHFIKDCCREIRLGAWGYKEGFVYEGWNTIKVEREYWLCISVAKNYNKTQMQRVYNYEAHTIKT